MPDHKAEGEVQGDSAAGKVGSFPRRGWRLWLPVVCLLLVAGYFTLGRAQAPPGKPGHGGQGMAVAVRVAQARAKDVHVYLNALGSVTPLNTVTVRSRVDGQLLETHFQEGQMVDAGSLLARIDPRPFEVQLAQASGQLLKDQALLENARVDLRRYKELWEQNSIPKQQLDTQEALVRQYEGVVKTDQAQVDNAKLQLIYCRITSPTAGRVGLRLVDPGNMVRASDQGGLVVVTQMQPISVVFSIPEDNIQQVLAKLKGGTRPLVEAFDREQKQRLAEGHLLTIDNQIDPGTGTVKLRAVFPNKARELFPNQFVNTRLLIEVLHGALVVPSASVQRGPQGAYVFLVKEDQTAALRKVKVGETQLGESVVTEGLNAGETVVVDGGERLREGAKVEIRGQDGPKGANGPARGK